MMMRGRLVSRILFACWLGLPVSAAFSSDTGDKPVVPVFELKGAITEAPAPQDLPFDLSGATGTPLRDLIARLNKARDDKNVKGVVMMLGSTSFGRAQAEELREAMHQLTRAGKKIHVHADTMSTGGLLLLSGASEISMVPTGYMFITGLYGEQLFLRGMLDKIGVQPDYFTCGAYKSAAEMFMRKGPSDESGSMQNWLMDSMYDNSVQLIARGRGVSEKKVRSWIDHGVFMAKDAKNSGIIQHVQHRQDFEASLRSLYGEDVEFDRRYGKKKSALPDLSSPMGMLQFYAELLQPPSNSVSDKEAIGLVYLVGPIVDGDGSASPFGGASIAYSGNIRRALDEAAADDKIKAVVFRVDSGGGSAVASEIILDASRRVAAKKPLIISMGNVAGSGGYYVACASKTIFADPSTITGSIGVVSGKFVTTGMWEHLGINWVPYKRGANSGMLSSAELFSDSERDAMQSYMNDVYEVFKGHVVAIRGDKLSKDIDDMAGGRVYTGRQALDLGLVDKLGGIEDAIAFAASEAKLDDYDIRVVPRPKNFMEMLMADLSGSGDESGHLRLKLTDAAHSPLHTLLPAIRALDPQRSEVLLEALLNLDTLQRERISLITPPIVFPDQN
jgi:protease IV